MSVDNKKSTNSAKRIAQSFTAAAADFERQTGEEKEKSRVLAWRVATVSTAVTVITIAALLVSHLMHKDPDPVIIKVDNSTGATTVLRSIKDAQDHYDDIIDKYWLGQYVIERENYDWYTISTAVDKVTLMSSPSVGAAYNTAIKAKDSPLYILTDKFKIIAKISSITFVGDEAQVHYTTQKVSSSGLVADGSPVQKWIATISYKYDAGLMTEQQRLVNPLGFKVLTYRNDPEVIQ
jgi:type IV secretion system protein VirB8